MTSINIHAEEDELKVIVEKLSEGGVGHSEIHDGVESSAKLNNPLSSPDLLIELLKLVTAAIQTTGAIVVLYSAIRAALKPGKKIVLVKKDSGSSIEVDENTTEEKLREFVG